MISLNIVKLSVLIIVCVCVYVICHYIGIAHQIQGSFNILHLKNLKFSICVGSCGVSSCQNDLSLASTLLLSGYWYKRKDVSTLGIYALLFQTKNWQLNWSDIVKREGREELLLIPISLLILGITKSIFEPFTEKQPWKTSDCVFKWSHIFRTYKTEKLKNMLYLVKWDPFISAQMISNSKTMKYMFTSS